MIRCCYAPPRTSSGSRLPTAISNCGCGASTWALATSVSIAEIDVAPVQIQGPKSEALMVDLFGERVREIPYYGLMEGQVNGRDVIVSQTGFTGEKGYEIYLKGTPRSMQRIFGTAYWKPASGINSW